MLFCSTAIFAQINYTAYLHRYDSLVQLNIGKQFPPFKVLSLAGDSISEKSLLKKVTVFNFWFRYCEPCVAEFEALNALNKKFKDNPKFQFISFTSDSSEDAKETVLAYKLNFSVCPILEKECFRLNFNNGFPTTIIVDEEGKIIYIKSGGYIEKQEVDTQIDKIANIIEKYIVRNSEKQAL